MPSSFQDTMANIQEHLTAKQELLQSGVMTYIGVMGISIWAGITSYFDKKEKFKWSGFIAHISSASFAGMMTFFGCDYAGISGPLMGVLCGVSAHMGTPALINLAMRSKLVRGFLVSPDDKEDKPADKS